MTQGERQDSLEEAIKWHLRLRDDRPEDWDEFVVWLEGDPQRSLDYDTVALADAELTPDAIPVVKLEAVEEGEALAAFSQRKWGLVAAGAAVAAICGTLLIPELKPDTERYEVATTAGEQRRVAIGDGNVAELNGGTRVVLDRKNSRYAELLAGEATFTVKHHQQSPFTVILGDDRIQDVGTVFNIVRDAKRTRIDVLEGQVVFNPDEENIPVNSGRTLVSLADEDKIVLGRKQVESMAGWRSGYLSFNAEPLPIVVGDLSRTIGKPVTIDAAMSGKEFTGSIRINGEDSVRRLAAAIGAKARQQGSGWVIEPL